MNLHNMSQKGLFDNYMAPPPTISRCYSSKANVNTFSSAHHFRGNSLFRMNKYLNNVDHFNSTGPHFGPQPGPLKMSSPIFKNSLCDPVKIVSNSFGDPVKIVGGFVGSKSQAGSTNHRGRECSLWDIILDKIVEVMERREQAQASKSLNKRKEHPKFEGFAMFTTVSCKIDGGLAKENWIQNDFPVLGMFEDNTAPRSDFAYLAGSPEADFNNRRNSRSPATCSQPTSFQDSSVDYSDTECVIPALRSSDLSKSGASEISTEQQVEDLRPPHPAFRDHFFGSNHQSLTESPTSTQSQLHHSSSCALSSSPALHVEPSCRFAVDSNKSESEDDSVSTEILSSSCESHDGSFVQIPRQQRSISECSASSDDSFIIFENPEDEAPDIPDDDTVIFSDESDHDYSSSDEDFDEVDDCILLPHNCEISPPLRVPSKLQEANQKWNESYANVNSRSPTDSKKVSFAEGKDLVKIKRLVAWDYAHRAARVGPWEMYRRDSERFKIRISTLSPVISPVLAKNHRKTVYAERFQT